MPLIATETKPKRQPKPKKNFGERLLETRDRLAAKVPPEDWDAVPTDASLRLEDYMEGIH